MEIHKLFWNNFIIVLALLHGPWQYAFSATYSFNKIIDSNTYIPETEDVFKRWNPPQISHGNIAFIGESRSGDLGIYLFANGILSRIVDENTVLPSEGRSFNVISGFSLYQNSIAFRAKGSRLDNDYEHNRRVPEGIWLWNNGSIQKVVGPEMSVSGSDIPLGGIGFWNFTLTGESVVFPHGGLRRLGPRKTIFVSPIIYLVEDGDITKLIDGNLLVTGNNEGITHLGIGNTSFHGNKLAFMGRDAKRNTYIYLYNNNKIQLIADGKTSIPGGHGTFTVLHAPALSHGNAVFQADGLNQKGIYLYKDSKLLKIVDLNTLISGKDDHFTHFHISPSLYKDKVAFLGFKKFIPYKPPELRTHEESTIENWASLQRAGVYIYQKGKINKVIENGDVLDGKVITSVSIGENCLSKSLVAFSVSFSDGSDAIYTATLNNKQMIH